jgi:hypothetical protein
LALAASGGFSQPGNLHVAVLVCSVMVSPEALGGPRHEPISFHFIVQV